jgi:UDP-N-acetylglucosamine diphosphorylase / glucose-1-phosphate thymidylyltransferase / UDP-N-acetylgalactosamine diphosphorylase / glucosamine-1-phosphate N-acetyltransferase / galactosamine-1-phosphate N-acetyltransferase
MLTIAPYIKQFRDLFIELAHEHPWTITASLPSFILKKIQSLSKDYKIVNDIAIHKDARIEEHVVLKAPIIISANCFIGAHAYLRGGVFAAEGVSIGPGCEIKSSILMPKAAMAHFNFVGDSIVGSGVNMEAGSIICNHYNDRDDKMISVLINKELIKTGVTKFGALVGDNCKIGANAVLSPGTILEPKQIVKRLELIEQDRL